MKQMDNHKDNQGFKIPENYFENFEDNVMNRLQKDHLNKKPIFFSHKIFWPIAATILLAGLSIIFLNKESHVSDSKAIDFSSLDSTEINAYLSSLEISDAEFLDFVPETLVDSLYEAEITDYANVEFDPIQLQDLEDEFSILNDDL
jgi:hypothetical protein